MSRTTFEPTFVPDPVATIDASAASIPQLPDAEEAAVWILSEGEGRPQHEIATKLRVSQGTVSRALARATAKIASLVEGGWITRDALDRQLRKVVGIAPRT